MKRTRAGVSVQSVRMSTHASFTRIAPHYDTLMRGVPYRMWVSYFELLCEMVGHKPKRVLDACCGTGTVCRLLAAKGLSVTGVDKSSAMILAAKEKAEMTGLDITFYAQDLAEMNLPETFDTALSFFDSLNYITEPERLRAALQRIAAHLEPDGLLVFDLNTEYAFVSKLFDQEVLTKGAPVRYKWRSSYDEATKLCTVRMEFWTEDPPESFTEVHVQRAHSSEEIRSWLKEAGFGDIRAYHSYSLERPRPTSDRVHYMARRMR